jgi:hypothetical protein
MSKPAASDSPIAGNGRATDSATICAPHSEANPIAARADVSDSAEPSVGTSIFLKIFIMLSLD